MPCVPPIDANNCGCVQHWMRRQGASAPMPAACSSLLESTPMPSSYAGPPRLDVVLERRQLRMLKSRWRTRVRVSSRSSCVVFDRFGRPMPRSRAVHVAWSGLSIVKHLVECTADGALKIPGKARGDLHRRGCPISVARTNDPGKHERPTLLKWTCPSACESCGVTVLVSMTNGRRLLVTDCRERGAGAVCAQSGRSLQLLHTGSN